MHALITAAAVRMDLGHKTAVGIEDILPARMRLNPKFTSRLFDIVSPIRLLGQNQSRK